MPWCTWARAPDLLHGSKWGCHPALSHPYLQPICGYLPISYAGLSNHFDESLEPCPLAKEFGSAKDYLSKTKDGQSASGKPSMEAKLMTPHTL